METIADTRQEKIERYVQETTDAVVSEQYTVSELRKFHGVISELNRSLALQEEGMQRLDPESLRFMHQVTKQALRKVGSRRKLETLQIRRNIRLRNSIVE